MANQKRNARTESGGRPKARQQNVGSFFLRARERLDNNEAAPPRVEAAEASLQVPETPEAVVDEVAVAGLPDNDNGPGSPRPPRKWLGISLVATPILLTGLFFSTPIHQPTGNAETAFRQGALTSTAVQIPSPTQIEADASGHLDSQQGSTIDELRSELAATRVELEKARAQVVAAQAVAKQQGEVARLGRDENTALRTDGEALRKALDTSGTREENLLRQLMVTNNRLADAKRTNTEHERQRSLMSVAVDEQARKARRLVDYLVAAQRELQRTRAQANAAQSAAEASLTAKIDALEEARRKAGLAEASNRQSIELLEASAQLASKKQADLLQSIQSAEVAAKQAHEAFESERERASALARDLESAHRERIAAQQELARVSIAAEQALSQERENSSALALALASARKDLASAQEDIDILKRRASLRGKKAISVADVGRRPALRRSEPSAQIPKVITLPKSLRPTRPPA